jgi:hypothetical protein
MNNFRICIECLKVNVPVSYPKWRRRCIDCYLKSKKPTECLINLKKDIKPATEQE